jgi:hypothetical protein
LCTVWTSHSKWPSEQISFITTMRLPILQLSCRLFFLAQHHITQVCQPPLQSRIGSLRLLAFPKAKIAVEREEICECDGHTVHKLSQRSLTADLLVPRESDCSCMHSKVSSDWMPSYIKATRTVLEIFIMAWYLPDSPGTPWRWNLRVVKGKGYSKRRGCEQTESRKIEKTNYKEYILTGKAKRTEYCSK